MRTVYDFRINSNQYALVEFKCNEEYWLYENGEIIMEIFQSEIISSEGKKACYAPGIGASGHVYFENIEQYMAFEESVEFLKREA